MSKTNQRPPHAPTRQEPFTREGGNLQNLELRDWIKQQADALAAELAVSAPSFQEGKVLFASCPEERKWSLGLVEVFAVEGGTINIVERRDERWFVPVVKVRYRTAVGGISAQKTFASQDLRDNAKRAVTYALRKGKQYVDATEMRMAKSHALAVRLRSRYGL